MQQRYFQKNDIRPTKELIPHSLKKTHPSQIAEPIDPFQAHIEQNSNFNHAKPVRSENASPSHVKPVREALSQNYPPKKSQKKNTFSVSFSHKRTSLIWAVFGFFMGVAFWHFIGFWDLVDKAIFQDAELKKTNSLIQKEKYNTNSAVVKIQQTLQTLPSTTNNDHVACVALVIDRKQGTTSARKCKPGVTFAQKSSVVQTAARADR